jgi:NAD(P)-dependent dehydrogenase (short-subunit alcohol dehydrogenase family)
MFRRTGAQMAGRLLSFDLKKEGVIVGMIHPGFLLSDMTDGMPGRDEAIEPSEAAPPFIDFVTSLTMAHTGEFWAPLGPKGIGNAEEILGKNLPTPLEVPW